MSSTSLESRSQHLRSGRAISLHQNYYGVCMAYNYPLHRSHFMFMVHSLYLPPVYELVLCRSQHAFPMIHFALKQSSFSTNQWKFLLSTTSWHSKGSSEPNLVIKSQEALCSFASQYLDPICDIHNHLTLRAYFGYAPDWNCNTTTSISLCNPRGARASLDGNSIHSTV